jgi:hypothetical protein
LILEDDVLLSSEITGLSEHIKQAPIDWKILQLTTTHPSVVEQCTHIIDPFISWQPWHSSTGAYVVNRAGMKTILNDVLEQLEDFPMVLADEVIYTTISDGAYTSTKLWVDTLDIITRKSLPSDSSIDGSDRRVQQPVFHESLLVLTNVKVDSTEGMMDDLIRIRQDVQVCKMHQRCEWEINVVFNNSTLQSAFQEASSDLPSNVHFSLQISSERFNKFAFLRQHVQKMGDYDLVLFKDNDQRIQGFPWRTFVVKRGKVVMSAPLRQSFGEAMTWNRYNVKPRQ